MISKKMHYGLKAILFLARRGRPALIAEVAASEKIPIKFLQAILLSMRKAGVLTSRVGKGGGYALAREAADITMGEVFLALDGSLLPLHCLEENTNAPCPECNPEAACGIKMVMGDIWEATRIILDSTTLASLLERMEWADKAKKEIINFTI